MEPFCGSGTRNIYSLSHVDPLSVGSDFWRVRNLLALIQSRRDRLINILRQLEAIRSDEVASLEAFRGRKCAKIEAFSVRLGCELSELLMSFNALKKAVGGYSGDVSLDNPFFFEIPRLEKEITEIKKRANRFLSYSIL